MSGWHPFDGGASIGQIGSEGGIIVRDDEHPDGARTTLEEGGRFAPFSITLGVYGWMVHTRFFSTRAEADAAYQAMRPDLAAILDALPFEDDPDVERKHDRVIAMTGAFVDRHP